MNYIEDILLNFTDIKDSREFYEWSKNDLILHVKKIPLIRINSTMLDDVLKSRVSVNSKFLKSIEDKTYTDSDFIKYSCLFTDLNKVIGVKFNNDGISIEKSNLLLDEEDWVIEDSLFLREVNIEYKVFEKVGDLCFLNRRDRYIRRYLLNELKYLYEEKMFSEIDYLYSELYNDSKPIKMKYEFLVDDISNNYNSKYNKLFDIIKLTQ